MTMFHKILLVCDASLGLEFLQLVQLHHNMNLDPDLMTKKLQMLVFSQVSNKQKVSWLK
jgi:hypothetical protein